jgi:hypothetical protein
MPAPFEGLLGNSNELKVIQFMLPIKILEFNISEIARGTGVSRQTLEPVIKKLAKWNLLKIASKHGNANYYKLNESSGFIEVFENLNNHIIEQMLSGDELTQIADYLLERCIQTQPIELPSQSRVDGWAAGGIEEGWSHLNREGRKPYAAA